MKKLITILSLCLSPFFSKAQTANAGADQTIYYTNADTAILDGSASSASSYLWSEISTDYSSGGTIQTPTSKTTTVTGLHVGTFYFQMAATTGGTTHYDTTVIHVNYTVKPYTSTIVDSLPMSTIAPYVNNRGDTTNYIGYTFPNNPTGNYLHVIWLERSRLPGMYIDTLRNKFLTTIEDGYAWNSSSYARSEAYFGPTLFIDSNYIYHIIYRGYFPQDSFYLDQSGVSWAAAVVFMQIHGTDSYSPPFGFNVGYHGNLFVGLNDTLGNPIDSLTVGQYADFVNHAHTIDLIWKESKVAGFVEVKIDGVIKYYHAGAQIGRANGQDYLKFASLYDYGARIVDPTNHTRNRKFSLVTERYIIYKGTDTSAVAKPTLSMSGNPTIVVDTANIYGTPTWASGLSGTYLWTQTTGAAATINSPTSSSTTVSGLSTGSYNFHLVVTQSDGQTAKGDVGITVTSTLGSNLTEIKFKGGRKKVIKNL